MAYQERNDGVPTSRPLAINETEGLAIVLERVVAHLYNNYPGARSYVAESIEWYDENQENIWERQESELPDNLTEEQARWAIDRLRSIWRDGNFSMDAQVFESMTDYSLNVLSIAFAEVVAAVQPARNRRVFLQALRQKVAIFTQDQDIPEDLTTAARSQVDVIAGFVRRILAEKRQP